MIKPFEILGTSEGPNNSTRVEFKVKRSEPTDKGSRTLHMQTAIYVPAGENIDMYIFNDLQQQGWIK